MPLERLCPLEKKRHGHVGARRETTAGESSFVRRSPLPGRDVRIRDGAWSTGIHPEGRRAAQRQAIALLRPRGVNGQRAVTTVSRIVVHRRRLASPGLHLEELEDVLHRREDPDLPRRRRRRPGEAAGEGVGVEAHPGGARLVPDGAE